MVLTSTLMVRPVEHPSAGKEIGPAGQTLSQAANEKACGKVGRKREESPTARPKGGNRSAAGSQLPGARSGAVPVASRPAARIQWFRTPYGPGSARAGADGRRTAGWLVKGRSDTRLHSEDPTYDPAVAQVWFQDESRQLAGVFTPWRKSTRRT